MGKIAQIEKILLEANARLTENSKRYGGNRENPFCTERETQIKVEAFDKINKLLMEET